MSNTGMFHCVFDLTNLVWYGMFHHNFFLYTISTTIDISWLQAAPIRLLIEQDLPTYFTVINFSFKYGPNSLNVSYLFTLLCHLFEFFPTIHSLMRLEDDTYVIYSQPKS